MAFIQGIDRFQMRMNSLEELIAKDNPVRFIDAFVEKIELKKLGFSVVVAKTEGRPACESKNFLKLYFYGYLNGIRSSRKLGQVKTPRGKKLQKNILSCIFWTRLSLFSILQS